MAFSSNNSSILLFIFSILGLCLVFQKSNAFCYLQEPGDHFWLRKDCHTSANRTITPANSLFFGMPPCFVGTNCTVLGRHSYWMGDIRGCVSEIFCGVAHSDLLCTTMRICQGHLCNGAPKVGGGIITEGFQKWMMLMIAALIWLNGILAIY